jgi:hypothetical protein
LEAGPRNEEIETEITSGDGARAGINKGDASPLVIDDDVDDEVMDGVELVDVVEDGRKGDGDDGMGVDVDDDPLVAVTNGTAPNVTVVVEVELSVVDNDG